MKAEYKEFTGHIPDEVKEEFRKLHDKGWFIDFRFDCEDGTKLQCRIWEEAFRANHELLIPQMKLVLGGDYRQPNLVTVRMLRNPTITKSREAQIISAWGSLSEYEAGMTKKCEKAKREGLVPIWKDTAWSWEKKDDCIKHLGAWQLKIEFCVNYLGAAYVTRRLRQMKALDSLTSITRGMSTRNDSFRKEYVELREKLVTEAKYLAGVKGSVTDAAEETE